MEAYLPMLHLIKIHFPSLCMYSVNRNLYIFFNYVSFGDTFYISFEDYRSRKLNVSFLECPLYS